MMMIRIDSVMPQTLTTAYMHIHIFVFSCNLLICTFPSIFLPALPRPSLSCKISEIFRPNNHCRANAPDDGPGTKDPVAPISFKGRRIENFAHRGKEENRWEHFPQLSLPLPFLLPSSQLGIPNIRYDIRWDTVCRIGYAWLGENGWKCCAHLPDRKKQRKSFTEGRDQCPILFW